MNMLKFKSLDSKEFTSQNTNQYNTSEQILVDYDNNLQNYLKNKLNRFAKVDFLIGNDSLISKDGILKEIGNDYIVLEMIDSNDLLVCDIYSIKFVQII